MPNHASREMALDGGRQIDSPIDFSVPARRRISFTGAPLPSDWEAPAVGMTQTPEQKRQKEFETPGRSHQYQSLAGTHRGYRLQFQGGSTAAERWPYRFEEATVLSPGLVVSNRSIMIQLLFRARRLHREFVSSQRV